MNNKTKKINPRMLYWVAFALYAVAAAIFALVDGGDIDRYMLFLTIFFVSYNVFDIRVDIMEIKEKLEHNPEAIDADYKPVE